MNSSCRKPSPRPAGLRQYPNYMMGGGYVLSGGVARALVEAHARTPLRFSPIEDATVGHWLTALDLRTVRPRCRLRCARRVLHACTAAYGGLLLKTAAAAAAAIAAAVAAARLGPAAPAWRPTRPTRLPPCASNPARRPQIDHPRFHASGETCCFNTSRWAGVPLASRFRLLDRFESDLCSTDPWLVSRGDEGAGWLWLAHGSSLGRGSPASRPAGAPPTPGWRGQGPRSGWRAGGGARRGGNGGPLPAATSHALCVACAGRRPALGRAAAWPPLPPCTLPRVMHKGDSRAQSAAFSAPRTALTPQVMHKIDSPAKMRYVGQRLANCSAPEPWVLPASIERYVSPDTRDRWAEQREAALAAAGGGKAAGKRAGSAPAADAAAGEADDADDASGGSSSSGGGAGRGSSSGGGGSKAQREEVEEQAHALDDDGHR